MTPFHPTFRRLLRRNIPQVHDEDLNQHESLFALRHQLVIDKYIVAERYVSPQQDGPQVRQQQEKSHEPFSQRSRQNEIDEDIANATAQAQAIFAPHREVYDASLRLWVARRQVMLKQGNFFQIPLSPQKLKGLVAAIWNYRQAQVQTFPRIAANRIKNVSRIKVLSIAIFVALLLACLYALTPEKPRPDQVQQEQIR